MTSLFIKDYPSISQIAAMIEEKNVNLIFAVTENKFKAYSQLNNVIPGSETGRLAGDSHNIVNHVRDNYGVRMSYLVQRLVGLLVTHTIL